MPTVDGRNRTGIYAATPLLSINPLRMIATVSHLGSDGRYGVDLTAIHAASKRASDVPTATQFRPAASTTLDLNAFWRIHKNAKITAAISNVTDRKYWNWSDVQGLAAMSTVLDSYTQPGRAYSLGLKVEF